MGERSRDEMEMLEPLMAIGEEAMKVVFEHFKDDPRFAAGLLYRKLGPTAALELWKELAEVIDLYNEDEITLEKPDDWFEQFANERRRRARPWRR